MLSRIYVRPIKGGWECYDDCGNVARGATKTLARNQYHILYELNKQEMQTGLPDMSSYLRGDYMKNMVDNK